jgi:hypothetical protein
MRKSFTGGLAAIDSDARWAFDRCTPAPLIIQPFRKIERLNFLPVQFVRLRLSESSV